MLREIEIYIGANISGIDEIAIPGGEAPADFHVTLIFGYVVDTDNLQEIVQKAVEKIKDKVPVAVKFDKAEIFDPSDGSNGKHVLYAKPTWEYEDALWRIHYEIIEDLSENGMIVRKTHNSYNPHLTLAYLDGLPKMIPCFDVTGKVDSISYGIGKREQEDYSGFTIMKSDTEKRLVFGWASVSVDKSGEQLVDYHNDKIDPEDLEEAAYNYVLEFRDAGEEHIPSLRKKARMVESCMFTKEKQAAIGIPEGTLPVGWWIGFYVDDAAAWEKIKSGEYTMFSIEGKAIREKEEQSGE